MQATRWTILLVAVMVTAAAWWAPAPAQAQETARPSTLSARSAGARLTVNETFTVMVDVEVEIDGQTYLLAVPATLRVDAQRQLDEARLVADNRNRIGGLTWDIRTVEDHLDGYALTAYTTISPASPTNKLIVVTADVTNLGRTPLNAISDIREKLAYDALGNLYQATRTQCDDINPGATGRCTLIFETPPDVTLSGLELAVVDRRRIMLTGGAE